MAYELQSLALNDTITGTTSGTTDTLYTASKVITQIDMVTAYNSSGTAATIDVYIVPSGGTASGTNPIISGKSVGNGATVILSELIGHKVPIDGTIQAFASTTNVIHVTISGGEQA